jgi:hypothetical protein
MNLFILDRLKIFHKQRDAFLGFVLYGLLVRSQGIGYFRNIPEQASPYGHFRRTVCTRHAAAVYIGTDLLCIEIAAAALGDLSKRRRLCLQIRGHRAATSRIASMARGAIKVKYGLALPNLFAFGHRLLFLCGRSLTANSRQQSCENRNETTVFSHNDLH